MPEIKINPDGTITVTRTGSEIGDYYDEEIDRRTGAMLKLMALGGDVAPLRTRIIALNAEKKQRLARGWKNA